MMLELNSRSQHWAGLQGLPGGAHVVWRAVAQQGCLRRGRPPSATLACLTKESLWFRLRARVLQGVPAPASTPRGARPALCRPPRLLQPRPNAPSRLQAQAAGAPRTLAAGAPRQYAASVAPHTCSRRGDNSSAGELVLCCRRCRRCRPSARCSLSFCQGTCLFGLPALYIIGLPGQEAGRPYLATSLEYPPARYRPVLPVRCHHLPARRPP